MTPDPDHYAPRWYDPDDDGREPEPVCEECDGHGEVVNEDDEREPVETCPECDGDGFVMPGGYDIPKRWEL